MSDDHSEGVRAFAKNADRSSEEPVCGRRACLRLTAHFGGRTVVTLTNRVVDNLLVMALVH